MLTPSMSLWRAVDGFKPDCTSERRLHNELGGSAEDDGGEHQAPVPTAQQDSLKKNDRRKIPHSSTQVQSVGLGAWASRAVRAKGARKEVKTDSRMNQASRIRRGCSPQAKAAAQNVSGEQLPWARSTGHCRWEKAQAPVRLSPRQRAGLAGVCEDGKAADEVCRRNCSGADGLRSPTGCCAWKPGFDGHATHSVADGGTVANRARRIIERVGAGHGGARCTRA